MFRVLVLVFLICGIGLYRLNELNETPIKVENFSTYNLVEIYALGLIMSVLGYALYPEVAIEHLSLYTPEKHAKKSDFFMKSKVVQEAISNYEGPTKLTWNNSVYMIGHPEARVALALNGATLIKKGKEILIKVPIGYPQNAIAPLLPGLVNWLLDMSHDEMREYLMETTKHVKFFADYTIDQQLKSNPVKDWMHHCLVFELNTSAQIGFKKFAPQGSSTHYAKTNEWLYASYCEFCMNSNNNIMSRSRFESLLMDIFNHQLHLNVYAKRNTKGLRIFNVAIRSGQQRFESYPSLVDLGENPDRYKEFYGQIDVGYKQHLPNNQD